MWVQGKTAKVDPTTTTGLCQAFAGTGPEGREI